ncbi:MAG: SH3 domain-containing protein [Erysipelotrichaceae bacterium]|nr:SH3 domain-containing protein [Erysipelotrichaceae bacterium]
MREHMKPEEPVMAVVIDCRKLNVREEPKADANVVDTIDVNSEIMIDMTESTDEFYKIHTSSGLEGFCMRKYIKSQS